MSKQRKNIPSFKSEEEERAFWESHDSTDYLDSPFQSRNKPEQGVSEAVQAAGCWVLLMERNSSARASLRWRAVSLSLMA